MSAVQRKKPASTSNQGPDTSTKPISKGAQKRGLVMLTFNVLSWAIVLFFVSSYLITDTWTWGYRGKWVNVNTWIPVRVKSAHPRFCFSYLELTGTKRSEKRDSTDGARAYKIRWHKPFPTRLHRDRVSILFFSIKKKRWCVRISWMSWEKRTIWRQC